MLLLLIMLILSAAVSSTSSSTPTLLEIKENTPAKATVANLMELFYLKNKDNRKSEQVQFSLVSDPNDLFYIDKTHLKLKEQVDREDSKICRGSNDGYCDITVMLKSGTIIKTIIFRIIDVNDNAPYFEENSIAISMSEMATNQDSKILSDAKDIDNNKGKPLEYSLKQANEEDLFEIFTESKTDTLKLRLKPNRSLDYESKIQHNLTLIACDEGKKCGDQLITVNVIDQNDNYPKIQKIQDLRIDEDLPVGSVIITVNATDADSGDNGEINFKINNNKDYFSIFNNGSIVLNKKLNARDKNKFNIKVTASDNGLYKKDAIDKFKIFVIDKNDHSPEIIVRAPEEIQENTNSEVYAAIIDAFDGDQDEQNKLVTCSTKHPFMLKNKRITIQTPLDYEQQKTINAVVICSDAGSPSLTSSLTIKFKIRNVNEFAPKILNQHSLFRTFNESLSVGQKILDISIIDDDADENITARINPRMSEFFDLIKISSQNHSTLYHLTLKKSIDYERIDNSTFKFPIIVQDSADGQDTVHSVTGTVTIEVTDVNDNAPKFYSPLDFELNENCKPNEAAISMYTDHNKLQTQDADRDEINRQVTFELVNVLAKKSGRVTDLWPETSHWPVNVSSTGYVTCTNAKIDRESFEQILLTVKAVNIATDNRLSSTATVTVTIRDVNDNQPKWIFPTTAADQINITSSHSVGEEITRVKASDADSITNITYTLITPSQYFNIDKLTGVLRATRPLAPGRFELEIRVDDNIGYSKHAITKLRINVMQHKSAGIMQLKDIQINLTIILAMIVLTGAVSIALVAAIVCVKRHNNNSSTSDSIVVQSDLQCCDKQSGFGCDCDHIIVTDHMNGCIITDNPLAYQSASDCQQLNSMFRQQQQLMQQQHLPYSTFTARSAASLQQQQHRNEVLVSMQDLDIDSADSGKGGSEDGHAGHHHHQLLQQQQQQQHQRRQQQQQQQLLQQQLQEENMVCMPPLIQPASHYQLQHPAASSSSSNGTSERRQQKNQHGLLDRDAGGDINGQSFFNNGSSNAADAAADAAPSDLPLLPPPLQQHGIEFRSLSRK